MEFEVGDKVIYPNHGLGMVEEIATKTIQDTTCGFYCLRMVWADTTVLVPIENAKGVGLRRAVADDEIKKLFRRLGNGKIEDHQNWKGRFKDNSNKMRTGSLFDMVEVLKGLNFLSKSKNLSFREKRMLDRSRFLIISEISEVTGQAVAVVEKKVDKALELCLVNRSRKLAKASAVKGKKASTSSTARRSARAS